MNKEPSVVLSEERKMIQTDLQKEEAPEKPSYTSQFFPTEADSDVMTLFDVGAQFYGMANGPINDPDVIDPEIGKAWWDKYGMTHGIFDGKDGLFFIHPDVRFWDNIIETEVSRIGVENFLIILGRAGTGKTTLLKEILSSAGSVVDIADTKNPLSKLPKRLRQDPVYESVMNVFPCSPTGVGCQNLRKALLRQKPIALKTQFDLDDRSSKALAERVNTPHTRFEMRDVNKKQETAPIWFEKHNPRKNSKGIYILNEALFCDSRTIALTLLKVPTGSFVILEGDPLQLPPVGLGEPVRALLDKNVIPHVINLTKVHRFAEDAPGLNAAVESILDRNEWPQDGAGFRTRITEGFNDMSDLVLDLMRSGYQVVTPTNGLAAWFGTQNAKRRYLQGPKSGRLVDTEHMFLRRGDRVRLLTSSRAHGVINGLEATYWGFSPVRGYHEVLLDNGKKFKVYIPQEIRRKIAERMAWQQANESVLRRDGWDDAAFEAFADSMQQESCKGLIMHAEAVTVHRAQGSEWDNVAVVVPWASRVLSREWLYVALSRAKKDCQVILMKDKVNEAAIEVVKKKLLTPCRRNLSKMFEKNA